MASRLEIDVPQEPVLLPRAMIWVYLVAPLGATPMMVPGFFSRPPFEMLQQLLGMYLCFIA